LADNLIRIFFGMGRVYNKPKERSRRKKEEEKAIDKGVNGFWADQVGDRGPI
jgi:hypothetical protein